MTNTAQDAATAARQTRARQIQEALNDARYELWLAEHFVMGDVVHDDLSECRACLTACLSHLDELARLIAQRDGMQPSDGPDVNR